MKSFISLCTLLILLLIIQGNVDAHPGRTDSSGGHTCRTNCSQWGLEEGEYHYHNGSGSSQSESSESSDESTLSESSNDTLDKDCSDFSSYDEVVEYWNSKGYSKTYDPERLDGWGNKVDDGIPCEAPSDYDTTRINNSPAQLAEKEAEQDLANGEKVGYKTGLSDGQKGLSSNSSSKGSDSYQEGFEKGYEDGYKEGTKQFETLKKKAFKSGYALGEKQDKLKVPQKFRTIKALTSSFEEGFNKAIKEKDEKKKEEFLDSGIKDGKADVLNEPEKAKDIFLDAYQKGYQIGQEELKETYVQQGYEAAFTLLKYEEPNLEKKKYKDWYKEGFKSNAKIKVIANVAYQAGLDGKSSIIPEKYQHAKTIYQYNFDKGTQERKKNNQAVGSVFGFGIIGWLGRRFYIARKMLK